MTRKQETYAAYRQSRRRLLYARCEKGASKSDCPRDGGKFSSTSKSKTLPVVVGIPGPLGVIASIVATKIAAARKQTPEAKRITVKIKSGKKWLGKEAEKAVAKQGFGSVTDALSSQWMIDSDQREYVGQSPPRNAGENDKSYARRAVDSLPKPKNLPEDHIQYFDIRKATDTVALSNLKPTRARPGGIERAAKFMRMTYERLLSPKTRRDPIDVEDNGDGTYTILDGNSTFATAKEYGWESIPVRVIAKDRHGRTYRCGPGATTTACPRDGGRFASGRKGKAVAGKRTRSTTTSIGGKLQHDKTSTRQRRDFLKDQIQKIYTHLPPAWSGVPAVPDAIVAAELNRTNKPELACCPKLDNLLDSMKVTTQKPDQPDRWRFDDECCVLDHEGTPQVVDGQLVLRDEFLEQGRKMIAEANDIQPHFAAALSGPVRDSLAGVTARPGYHIFDSAENFEKGKAAIRKHPERPHVIVGGVKGLKRAAEKAAMRTDGSWIHIRDLVRATVLSPSVADLATTVERTSQSLDRSGFKLVSLNDRVNKPTNTGYRDVQMSFRHEETGHICELLITTSDMWMTKESAPTSHGDGAHKLYEVRRSIMEVVEAEGGKHSHSNANKVLGSATEEKDLYVRAWDASHRDSVYGGSGSSVVAGTRAANTPRVGA